MTRVYVGIGSNIERERNVSRGVEMLRECYGELVCSSVYECEAVGFEGEPFYNMVAGFDTEKGPHAVSRDLHAIEDRCGRERTGPRFSARTLDIDLLLHGDIVLEDERLSIPRDEITTCAFVLWPLAEIAGQLVHPVENRSYAELWIAFGRDKQKIWLADFSLDCR